MSSDFVARAGSVIDRAHRMAGVLLIIVIVQSVMLITMWARNGSLSATIDHLATRLPVYVIPGSTRGIYSPTEDDLLINAFADTVTQSFNTFTYETLSKQYEEMRQFFTPEMLTFSQSYFEKLMSDTKVDRRSQLFVPDRRSLVVQKGMDNGVEARSVSLRGSLQTIVAGSVVESVPLEINMRLRKVIISKTNPFGFLLAGYNVRRLQPGMPPAEMAPLQPGSTPPGLEQSPATP